MHAVVPRFPFQHRYRCVCKSRAPEGSARFRGGAAAALPREEFSGAPVLPPITQKIKILVVRTQEATTRARMCDTRKIKAKLEHTKQLVAEMHEQKRRKEEERKKKESEEQRMAESTTEDPETRRCDISEELSLEQPLHLLTWDSCYFHYLVPTPMSPSSQSVSACSENGSQESVDGGTMARMLQWDMDPSALQLLEDLGHRTQRLEASEMVQIDYIPEELVTYSKETQTPFTPKEIYKQKDEEKNEELPAVKPEPDPQQHVVEDNLESMKENENPKELTGEEKEQIVHSEDFLSFFDRSVRLVERALSEDLDIFFDYSGRDMEDKEGDTQAGFSLSFNRQFYDEQWSKRRVVTCLDWSSQHSELLTASYNANEHAPQDPDGVVLVWNMKFKKTTPEYIFHCQSSVMSVGFAQFHPNLIVGGTYSGQVVLWDNRSHRRTPVQRTPLSAAAHTHPVSGINVVGTENANTLTTVSTDGKMCSWSLDMLSKPQDSMELYSNKSRAIAVTGMAFPVGEVNHFVVGSTEGTVYAASRRSNKPGINQVFKGHQGPVTGISCHHAVGPIDFSNLFITSSFDWTVKLWSTKHHKALCSFEDNVEYVYDVMWSPVHPAVFATVDGLGRLDIWNLNKNAEVPTASVTVEGSCALNRVRWASGGHEVAAGDSEGRVWIYDVGEQLAVPQSEDWSRLGRFLVEF